MRELAKEELKSLTARRDALLAELKILLDPERSRTTRRTSCSKSAPAPAATRRRCSPPSCSACTAKYAERQGWRIEVMSSSDTGVGGLKEVIATIEGRGVYSKLKYESGVHRVQRVPATEASGRIHTSTATVAVLPEAEEVDVQINDKDLRIDTFCSSGPGGQSVNTTYSAVRITHLPTNIVVSQQDEKSQIKNRAKAMKVLRSRLYEMELRKQQEAIAKDRRSQVGTGERSEKIRTYNFPQSRITDHRINFTTHRLDEVLNGDLAELLENVSDVLSVREAERRDRCLVKTIQGIRRGRAAIGCATPAFCRPQPTSTRGCSRSTCSAGTRRSFWLGRRRRRPTAFAAALRYARRPPSRSRAARLHHRPPGVLGSRARSHAGGADPAARNRAHRRSRARRRFRTIAAVHDRSTPAPAAAIVAIARRQRTARTPASSRPTSQSRRSRSRGATPRGTASKSRVTFVAADLLRRLTGPVDLDHGNPPYVAERNAPGLQPEVARPRAGSRALRRRRDGLRPAGRVVREAPPLLRPGGFLIFEFGFGQDVEVEALRQSVGRRDTARLEARPSGHRADCYRAADLINASMNFNPGSPGSITPGIMSMCAWPAIS